MKKKVKYSVKEIGKKNGILQKYGINRACTGVPGEIRTHDPLLRRQPLYPAELQGLEAKI